MGVQIRCNTFRRQPLCPLNYWGMKPGGPPHGPPPWDRFPYYGDISASVKETLPVLFCARLIRGDNVTYSTGVEYAVAPCD